MNQVPKDSPAFRYGRWYDDTSCVDGLEDSGQIDSSGNLFDEYWRYSLGTKLLVHAQVVDLDHLDFFFVNFDQSWNGTDEADELVVFDDTHAAVPLFEPASWLQSPSKRTELKNLNKSLQNGYKQANTISKSPDCSRI